MNVLLLFSLVPAAVLGQCLTKDDSAPNMDPTTRRVLYEGQQQFSINMLNEVNDMSRTENTFFSPFSIYNALLLAYFISANHTEEYLKKALLIPLNQTKVDVMQAYTVERANRNIMAKYGGSSEYELLNANRLFISNKLKVRDCMKGLFQDEIAMTDFFTNPKVALDTINGWVAKQTKDQIKDLLNEGQVTENTEVVLANAAYFKGLWKNKFQPEATRKEVFYITNSQNAITMMMKQKSAFNHLISEKLGAHVLELPYKGESVSLVIFLPPFASPNGISDILKRLKGQDIYKMINDEMMLRPVEVSIPKFSIQHELQLTQVLGRMGIGELFAGTSDLSGLTGVNELKLDDAVHKAKIKVDEEGTTASAATAIFNFRSSRPLDPAKFICNHPFVYVIFDKTTQTILFTGIYNKPPK